MRFGSVICWLHLATLLGAAAGCANVGDLSLKPLTAADLQASLGRDEKRGDEKNPVAEAGADALQLIKPDEDAVESAAKVVAIDTATPTEPASKGRAVAEENGRQATPIEAGAPKPPARRGGVVVEPLRMVTDRDRVVWVVNAFFKSCMAKSPDLKAVAATLESFGLKNEAGRRFAFGEGPYKLGLTSNSKKDRSICYIGSRIKDPNEMARGVNLAMKKVMPTGHRLEKSKDRATWHLEKGALQGGYIVVSVLSTDTGQNYTMVRLFSPPAT